MAFQDMDKAPRDGTWIIGVDEDGREARIQSRKTHPMADHRHWAEGEEVSEGNWIRSKCFYPVKWRPE